MRVRLKYCSFMQIYSGFYSMFEQEVGEMHVRAQAVEGRFRYMVAEPDDSG